MTTPILYLTHSLSHPRRIRGPPSPALSG